jgi:hypothetical protein
LLTSAELHSLENAKHLNLHVHKIVLAHALRCLFSNLQDFDAGCRSNERHV